jgi:hypothetical protein
MIALVWYDRGWNENKVYNMFVSSHHNFLLTYQDYFEEILNSILWPKLAHYEPYHLSWASNNFLTYYKKLNKEIELDTGVLFFSSQWKLTL